MAARAVQRKAGDADARVSQLIVRHERSLMRVAQHWSLCRDDALDAYQRALEIYLRRVDSLDPATEMAWMKVVVKHEAIAVRRSRSELVPVEDIEFDDHATEFQRPVDDLLAGRERVTRSAEALRRIKPDEARALVLKAQGLSYAEIGDQLGWTYTKVNRCLTEGRARFLRVYAEIEAGEACERFAPTLAALVGGTASADALLELRPHIRNCPSCRATVRELHATSLGRLGALFPLPALVGLKAKAYGWLQRWHGSDIATGAQLAAGTGGGRIATLGAVVGLCLSSLGAGTVCVVTGVVNNPFAGERPKAPARPVPKKRPAPPRRAEPRPIVTPVPTPVPAAATPKQHAPSGRRQAPAERRRGTSATHEQPAPAPAPAGTTQDFSFEQTDPSAPAAPAAAPSNGGGEFAP